MSFKFFHLLILFFLISACGVKSGPVPPKGTELPNYVDQFLKPEAEAEEAKDED